MSGDAEIRTITQVESADLCALRRCAFQTWTADPPTGREIDCVVPEAPGLQGAVIIAAALALYLVGPGPGRLADLSRAGGGGARHRRPAP